MITALLVGLIKTVLIAFWGIINTIFSAVFSGYVTYMSEIVDSTGAKIACGFLDVIFGWSWFVTYVTTAVSVLIVIRLAKYLIGLLSKG